MPSRRTQLGDFGEQVALAHLARQGCTLVARKWRCSLGEIDLVVRDGAALVFVEVRTRRGAALGQPEESVGPAKRAKLSALAYTYLDALSDAAQQHWRIDVIAVEVAPNGRVAAVRHIRSAVEE